MIVMMMLIKKVITEPAAAHLSTYMYMHDRAKTVYRAFGSPTRRPRIERRAKNYTEVRMKTFLYVTKNTIYAIDFHLDDVYLN